MSGSDSVQQRADGAGVVSRARALVMQRAGELGCDHLADDAALVVSELVTNAVLHGGGCTKVEVTPIAGGVRIAVHDASRVAPIPGLPSDASLTGRGIRLVASLSTRWGSDTVDDGKVVWADVTGRRDLALAERDSEDLLAMWGDDWAPPSEGERRYRVVVPEVLTDLLLAAKSHVDNVVRELTLVTAGERAGQTAEVPAHLRSLVGAVVDQFAEARTSIKRQAVMAAQRGDERTSLVLELPASAADAAEQYVRALDEVDAYSRARRMLTLETPPQHRVFRHWYIEEVVRQLRAAAAGLPPPVPQTFERRLLAELDRTAAAQRAAERGARLYAVASALARAGTPEAVAQAVLDEGVAALGASGGGVLVATDADRLSLPVAVGYDDALVARLRSGSRDTELPDASVLRTGEPVWLESRTERDERFPELAGLEASAVALCAVPLEVQGRRLGALRFSFREARLFDEDERRFVLALAALTAQALERAQLEHTRVDVSRRLQRSLLPPSVPAIPGVDLFAVYHPFGNGIDVGGDFYDVWALAEGRWAVAIGDAAGTGPEAAGLTAVVRHTLRALTIARTDPAEVMLALNQALLAAAPDESAERFCTVLLGLVTVGEVVDVRLFSGGHPPPVVRRADGSTAAVPVGGSLLGVLPDVEIRSTTVQLAPGDTLVLVTDGVLEARSGDGVFFDVQGVERALAAPVAGARQVADALDGAILGHTGGTRSDDMVAVVLHVPPPPGR